MIRTLVTISSDPRTSARPAEAVRIAAGAGSWKKTEIRLLLRGPAGYALSEFADDLVDEDNFNRYLPIINEWNRPIYVGEDFADADVLRDSPWKHKVVTTQEIARLYLEHQAFIQM
jgi:hypothetical protein